MLYRNKNKERREIIIVPFHLIKHYNFKAFFICSNRNISAKIETSSALIDVLLENRFL